MFYKKGIDITNAKQMFNFIYRHYTYYTLNSWNGLKSIANNVKVYNLHLDGDDWTALRFLEEENYYTVNEMIHEWEADHPGYLVGFNGRSGGYLVLYNKDNNRSIVPECLLGYDDYEDFKNALKEGYYKENVKDYLSILRETTKLIQDFDKLCDEIRDHVNYLSKLNFEDEKIERDMENFIYDYRGDMDSLGITYPGIEGKENGTILISIDPKMRKYKSLMECFFRELKEECWTILDDGSSLIKLETV